MKIRAHNGSGFVARLGAVCAAAAMVSAPAPAQSRGDEGGPNVRMRDDGTIDLTVQETDLPTVLEMLSIQGRKNIITSKQVTGKVTANLFDVTFYEALDAILRVNGYVWIEDGNFIYVYTQQEALTINRQESRIFELEYISSTDAEELIKPLLSPNGKMSSSGAVQAGIRPDPNDAGADGYAYAARVVVNDYKENLESVATLLGQLDTPPQQVLIEAAILATTVDEADAWGVDFSAVYDMDYTDLTAPLAPVANLLAGADTTDGFQPADNEAGGLQTTVGNTTGPGGLKIGVVYDDFSAFIRLLDEVTDTTVLARPKVLVLNRQRAEVLVGARVGYLSTTTTQTTSTQTVQFLDTGIQLLIRPFISRNGMIRMELAPSVSEASLRTVTDAAGQQVTIPDELTNELTSNVRVRDGHTLVLGGMFKETMRTSRRQVPLLGDIPLLGAPFRGQDDSVDRDEIIFLITPSVLQDEVLYEIGEELVTYADSIRIGARAGLLPFSRSKVTAGYNRQAMDAYRRGNLNLALHFANKSLGMHPNQPEMIELRRELTGRRERAHDASLMERAYRGKLGPLPREQAEIPQEVAAAGGSAAQLVGMQLDGPKQWTAVPTPARPVSGPPKIDRTSAQGMRLTDPGGADPRPESKPAPAPAPRPAAQRPVSRMPQAPAQPGFWRAGNDPAGLDDPSWRSAEPFSTLEGGLEPQQVPPAAP